VEEAESRYQLVLCTCPDRAVAEDIAADVVRARLAACVNVIDGITSIYEWQGKINKDGEVLLLIKSRSDRFDALRSAIVKGHPYELPEVVAVAIDTGLTSYLRWIDTCVTLPR
jgi:periplasmic divalent cation tolerance protein